MPMVLITCQVEDTEAWETNLGTYGALLCEQTVRRLGIGISEADHVAGVFHVDDLRACMRILESPETADPMENNGVKRDTVKPFVLDRRFDP